MWNLFWGLYILAFGIACLIVAYAVGWRSMRKTVRCTARTTGVVERYSSVVYNGVHLPVVRYRVGDAEYTVTGPKFKAGVKVSVSTPFGTTGLIRVSNLDTRENLPDVYKVMIVPDTEEARRRPWLPDLYPVGSHADVFYDPAEPKCAYVQRHVPLPQFLAFWMPLVFGVVLTVLALWIMICQPITM